MLDRVLEPEVMDSRQEAIDYDAMDHAEVNRQFVADLLAAVHAERIEQWAKGTGRIHVLDVGTGTAQIPIELCRRAPWAQVTGLDLAAAMLEVGRRNVGAAGLSGRIDPVRMDAKAMPIADASYPIVMSNSIVHHVPEPRRVLAEMVRVLAPDGLLFVRDLVRPPDESILQWMVQTYAADANDHQRGMFAASLRAALTLDELRDCTQQLGLPADSVRVTSDRHWTCCYLRPESAAPATRRGRRRAP